MISLSSTRPLGPGRLLEPTPAHLSIHLEPALPKHRLLTGRRTPPQRPPRGQVSGGSAHKAPSWAAFFSLVGDAASHPIFCWRWGGGNAEPCWASQLASSPLWSAALEAPRPFQSPWPEPACSSSAHPWIRASALCCKGGAHLTPTSCPSLQAQLSSRCPSAVLGHSCVVVMVGFQERLEKTTHLTLQA